MHNGERKRPPGKQAFPASHHPLLYSENIMEPLSLEMGLPRKASLQVVPRVTDRMS